MCALPKIFPLISEMYMVIVAGDLSAREGERERRLHIIPFDKLTTNETDTALPCPAHDEGTLLLSKVTQSSLIIL